MAGFEFLGFDAAALGEGAAAGDSLFELGMKYSVGIDVPVDLVSAHMWFNLAAAKGNADSQPIVAGLSEASWCSTLGSQMMKPRKPMFHRNTAAQNSSTDGRAICAPTVVGPVSRVEACDPVSASSLAMIASRSAALSQLA